MTKPIKLTWTGYKSIGRSDVVAEYSPSRKSEMHYACRYRTLIVKGRGGYYIQVNSERFKAWGQAGPDVFIRDGIYGTKEAAMQAVEDYMNEKERTLIEEWEDSIANSRWWVHEVYLRKYGREHTLNPNDEKLYVTTEEEAKELVKQMEVENNYPKNPDYASLPGETYIRAVAFNPVTRFSIRYNIENNTFWYATS
jgi:hypothetical protein